MSTLSEKIFELRSQNKSYGQISKELNCSKATISYYLAEKGKEKVLKRTQKRRKTQCPILNKLESFKTIRKRNNVKNNKNINRAIYDKLRRFNNEDTTNMITKEQLLDKIGPNPTCYLTGLPIDIDKPHTYELDHIIPRSRGGDNSIDNLGLCTKQANRAKSDMSKDEFINLCNLVHNFHKSE